MRPDLSKKLIHFTKGNNDDEAFENLFSILIHRCIFSTKMKNSQNSIVCLTETPLNVIIDHGFVNYTDYTIYNKFGIMFDKKDIYDVFNGRPALYLEKDCINKLDEDIKWRCTLFEPKFNDNYKTGNIDFSWEREWRVKDDIDLNEFEIDDYIVLVPNEDYKKRLEKKIDEYYSKEYDDCNLHNPRYFRKMEYDYFEDTYVEIEIENEDNCECNRFDPDENTFKIFILDKNQTNP
ncbi:MAG: hypothetical protein DCF13_02150 [Flavobacteriaceae bacterium]|nr:MAG: hypothetical protein DCF13_02150 [Flavobacteriaceae bacterium]